MNRPCRPGVCRHCKPGLPCAEMRRYLAEEAEEMDAAEAADLAREARWEKGPERPRPAGSWFDRDDPWPIRGGYLIDDPIHAGRF